MNDHSLDERRRLMSRVRSRDTTPELAVRRGLHARGLRFRLHNPALPGRPDIVLRRHGLVIFVHGCFWHGCPDCDRGQRKPKTNSDFWSEKLQKNKERDARVEEALKALGWKVAVVWECATRQPAKLEVVLDALNQIMSTKGGHDDRRLRV